MSDKEKPTGLDASLEALRKELESMQKQDKDLYKQLLGLQESIKGLKVELKRERDECEEAFRDLQEISQSHSQTNGEPTENKQNITTEQQTTPREQLKDKPSIESEANMEVKNWKHDRQDSGISVKNYEVESSAGELTAKGNGAVSSVKPAVPIIRHSKQDSGILLDDETAESETKLLSRLVQSSREFFKTDNRKLMQSVHNRLRHGVLNQKPPNRSMSSNDLNKSSVRPIRDPNSRPIIPKHSHSRSCPSTAMKRFNQESCDYKVVPSHHVRPTQRSASVVNLNNLDKKDSNASYHPSENGIRSNVMAKSEPNLGVGGDPQANPLRAVLVSACEVNVSNTCERRDNVGPQRCITVLGPLKPGERPFHDSKHMKQFNTSAVAQRDSGYLSLSPLQFPRNHARHRTMPENNEIRRRHSLNIWHSSSKSWDGSNIGRSRELANLLRSSSQVSLV